LIFIHNNLKKFFFFLLHIPPKIELRGVFRLWVTAWNSFLW
jgi:hypothetical protein